MPKTVAEPQKSYGAGTHQIRLAAIPKDSTVFHLQLTRPAQLRGLSGADVSLIVGEISYDDGVTWRHWFTRSMAAGPLTVRGRAGSDAPADMKRGWPMLFDKEQGKAAMAVPTDVRLTLDVARGFETAVTMEAL